MTEDSQSSIAQLQVFEGQLQSLGVQRQQLQAQVLEVESAFEALQGAETAFRIVGGIMVKGDPLKLSNELSERKESLSVRLKTVERQEQGLKAKAQELQEQVLRQGGSK